MGAMKKTVAYVFIGVLGSVLVACSTMHTNWPTARRTAPPHVPPYPNMQHVETSMEQNVDGLPMQVTTFATTDAGEQVVAFYKEHLLQEGWTVVDQDDPTSIVLSNQEACPLYGLAVWANVSNPTITGVRLQLMQYLCLDQ